MKVGRFFMVWIVAVGVFTASRQGLAQSQWPVFPLPNGQTVYTYGATATPYRGESPALSRPIGVGPVASGGDAVAIQVSLHGFSGPVDIFLALIPPGNTTESPWFLRGDGGLQPLAAGVVPWKRGVSGQVHESLFGYVPVSLLSEGTYVLYMAVTPTGDGLATRFDAWATSFEIGPGAQENLPGEPETTSVKVMTWVGTIGGEQDDHAYAIGPTSDGGYVAAGRTSSTADGSVDVYLVRTDVKGVVQWERAFGGTDWDEARAVQETGDGGFVVVGSTRSFGGGGSDYLLIRTDAAGNDLWATALGGPGNQYGFSVIETADGGFLVAGQTSSVRGTDYDLSLVKTDPKGGLLWAKTYGGIRDEAGYSVVETPGGGFMVAGYTASTGHGMEDVYLIRTNGLGELVWEEAYGGEGNERGHALIQTTGGQYVITGKTWSYGAGGYDVLLLHAGQDGTLGWLNVYGGNGYDCGNGVAETSDGGFIVAGETDSFGQGDVDVYSVRTDQEGTAIWERTFGGAGDDSGYSVLQAADGGFLIGGDTTSYGAGGYDGYLIKTDQDGAVRRVP